MTTWIAETDKKYVANTYGRFPIELVDGHGSIAIDSDGKEYIDLGSGIAVTSFGISDPDWIKAVTEQLGKIQHASNLYYTQPCAELAKLICERTGMSKVFFGNSGAEANECAIKVARKYGEDVLGRKNPVIVTLENGFHGRTLGTLAATGQDVFHKDFQPLPEGFAYAPANDIEATLAIAKHCDAVAIMIECIQGEGGVNVLEQDYVKALAAYCEESDTLLLIDEVQTGNGRTGELYSYMHYGIKPDVFTTAKGLGGGLPIGACVMGEKVADVFGPSDHGSTFGGNPVACAGAISILSRIDATLLDAIKLKGEYIRRKLEGAKGIQSVSGMGLMVGFVTDRPAKEIVNECIEEGVLCLTAKSKVRLIPALNIPMEKLEEALEIIKEVCAKGL
ncbi:MAG: aspartate aminotransferase family protein [Coriobacteriales bacterium]|nr:aspartate aminotransferase family protein [Coriobacteriales bacterium]